MRKTIIAMLGVALSACATTPTPQEICSAEWINHRTDKAIAEFSRNVRPLMRTFKKASKAADQGNSLGVIQSMQLVSAIQKMIDKVETSQALRDIELVADTCDDPDLMINVFAGFMREQGASEEVIGLIESARVLIEREQF